MLISKKNNHPPITVILVVLASLASAKANPSPPTIQYIDRILPTPQNASYGDWLAIQPSSQSPAENIQIVLGENPTELDRATAQQITRYIERLQLARPLEVITAQSGQWKGPDRSTALVVYLGAPDQHPTIQDQLASRKLDVPDQPEGYLITSKDRAADSPPQVFLAGRDDRGTFYAAQSLMQMLTARDGKPALRALEVSDWPTYQLRTSGNDESIPESLVPIQAVDWLSHIKLNSWAAGQSYHWPEDWRVTPAASLQTFDQAAGRTDGTLDAQFQIHPFGRADDPDRVRTIRISNPSDRKAVVDIALDRLKAGATQILLRADDFHELAPEDETHYPDKAAAHTVLILELHKAMKESFPDAELIFCPPYYTGKEARESPEANAYLRAIGRALPDDIGIMWTGPDVVSHEFTSADLADFATLINRPPILWDNTVFHEETDFNYPYLYAWNLYDPFQSIYPPNHPEASGGVRFNYGFNGTQMSRVVNLNLSDYLWNPAAYNPDQSLRNAIGLIAGPGAVDVVLQCVRELQTLFDLRHSPARLQALSPIPREEDYWALIGRLENSTQNTELVEELRDAWYTHAETARAAATVLEELRGFQATQLMDFPMNAETWNLETRGDWSARFTDGVVQFSFPFETPSEAGTYATAGKRFQVPASPSRRYHLALLADDDYYAEGEPPNAWPGYFFKQVLIDGVVVWEEDVVGMPPPRLIQIDVTDHLRAGSSATLELRGFDAKGVTNLGVQIAFSNVILSSLRE